MKKNLFSIAFFSISCIWLSGCTPKSSIQQAPEPDQDDQLTPVDVPEQENQPDPVDESADPEVDPMVSVNTLFEAPHDFAKQRIGSDVFPVPSYAKYLKGVKICLDPGHGGQPYRRGYKRGPTGVREAEMNLRVAQYLRDCLEECGAEVLLTREGDTFVSLADRGQIAERWGADLFISCHHNAIGKPTVNRTSVWYHLGVDHHPANLDLARYLCHGLLNGLQLPQVTGNCLNSDQLMYKDGFGVLRVPMTSALIESSFFTHPEEEQRLRTPEYNFLEAYSLFDAIARYAYAGLPKVKLIQPEDGEVTEAHDSLLFKMDDGLRKRGFWGSGRQLILSDSIEVRIDGESQDYVFQNKNSTLKTNLPEDLSPGGHFADVRFMNFWKNSALNPHVLFDVEGIVNEVNDWEIDYETSVDPVLQAELRAIDLKVRGELGIPSSKAACGMIDLDRGRLAMMRPDSIFYGASVPKIVILLAYFNEHPKLSELTPDIKAELGKMIKISSNELAAKYSRIVGLENIRDLVTGDEYRFYNEKKGGGLWLGKHYSQGSPRFGDPVADHSHAVTVRQLLRYYLMLDQGRLVDPDVSSTMLEIFESPELDHLDTYFVKGLKDHDAKIWRKSGTWENWRLDSAIIEIDEKRFILVGMAEHEKGSEYLQMLAAKLAEKLVPTE